MMFDVSPYRWLILACCLWSGVAASSTVAYGRGVIIALAQQPVAVKHRTVRIGDVARVVGGTTAQQRFIAELDLETLIDQSECRVHKPQVITRLLLSGFSRDEFEVTGPESVMAWRTSPTQIRDHLLRRIAEALGEQFGMESTNITVRLVGEGPLSEIESAFPEPSFDVRVLPPNEFPIGRHRLSVEMSDSAGRRLQAVLDCQVGVSMRVAIVTQPVARGSVIRSDMVRLVDREIVAKADYANPGEVVGRTANRYVPSNSILLASYLLTTRGRAAAVIQRNDLIDVVVPIGSGEIRLKNAQALEAGGVGDVIEVLNPNSGRRINASVVGPNLATTANHSRRY